MSRRALLLAQVLAAAFLAQAFAEGPKADKAPVAQIFLGQLKGLDAAARKDAGSCEDLRRCAALMTQPSREAARGELLKLEGRTQAGGVLTEIGQGFIALGFPQDAMRMLRMRPFDAGSAPVLSQAAGEFLSQGRYDLALAWAEEALKLDPSNEAALAVARLSERKVGERKLASMKAGKDLPAEEGGPVDGAGSGAKPVAFTKRPDPAARLLPPAQVYHMPDAKPPSTWQTVKTGVGSLWAVYWHKAGPEENASLAKLKAALSSLPSGADLIKQMGGWERIEKEVYFMYTDMGDDGTAAYVRPMAPWEEKKKGKKYVLAINSNLAKESPEAVLPVFGHELSHVADKMAGNGDVKLAVTSEHAAHLRQVYLFQEVERKASPEKLKQLEASRIWLYQKWLTSMWEDKILARYPRKEDYQNVFAASKNLRYLAGLAYDDIQKKAVKDGTPQVLFHVSDLYANATSEPETTEDELLAELGKATDPAQRAELEALLKKLRSMRKSFLSADAGYRDRTGQTLP